MDTSPAAEPFRGLLLRHRGRTGLTQRELADRLGANRRTVQEWETGVSYPSAENLKLLVRVLLEAGGLTAGREAVEAHELWAAVLGEARRMQTPFDHTWFDGLLAARAAPPPAAADDVAGAVPAAPSGPSTVEHVQDWGEAPDASGFVGRAEKLATLRAWVLEDRCRLVAVLGMGGIGKTMLAARLAQEVAPSFRRVYWRSMRDAPPTSEWLAGAIGFLSDQRRVVPDDETARRAALLELLRDQPSVLVLDNFETLLEPGEREARYRAGYDGYGRLLQAIGEMRHQSCVVLTSREAPLELATLGGTARSLELDGLGVPDGQVLLADKQLSGTTQHWAELVGRFGGNGLALKVVGEGIRQVFGGDINAYLEGSGADTAFGGIRRLLAEQIGRSSPLEQDVLRVLAVEREPVTVLQLLAELAPHAARGVVLQAFEALRRRSLVERAETAGAAAFTLQSVVLEYVTDRLVETVADEVQRDHPVLLVTQPLIKAQAKDYVRQTQERMIGEPILRLLGAQDRERGTEQMLLGLLHGWRGRSPAEQGFGPGNVVNLLRLLRGELCELDLSRLAIRQSYLADVDARDASLLNADLAETVLAGAFDLPGSVALSGDGALLAAGTLTGQVWLWRVADRTPLLVVQGHTGGVWGVALSSDGRLLASGGGDGLVRLWETSTGQPLAILHGHAGAGWRIALSGDGRLVASGGDGTVRLWETSTGQPVATLAGHIGTVWGVALSADGKLVASGGEDGTVRLWETSTAQPLAILQGHTGRVRGVALSTDGQLLASSGGDGTVRLWETSTGQPLAILHGHTGGVWGLALSADDRVVASGGGDGAVRLWEASTGRPLATLQGHTGTVWGVALSADGRLVASSGGDGAVRLWEASTGRPLATLQGHTGTVWGVALSADGRLVAGAGADGTLRLWETSTGRALATLQGSNGTVWCVSLSADGHMVASGGEDGTVRLWDVGTRRALATLEGHAVGVQSVALSATGHLVASAGQDGAVRLWEAGTGRRLATLEGHTGTVWGVALSSDSHLIASAGEDGTVRLWEAAFAGSEGVGPPAGRTDQVEHSLAASTRTEGTGLPSEWRALAVLQSGTSTVWEVALSADGRLVASGGSAGTVQLWEAEFIRGEGVGPSAGQTQQFADSPVGPSREWRPLVTLQGHTGMVRVALSAEGHLLASGGEDGTVRLWETGTWRALATLQGHAGGVRGMALSADGHMLVSAGFDGTVRLWAAPGGTHLRTLRMERRYERLDITGLTGITEAQRAALLSLGAVEQD